MDAYEFLQEKSKAACDSDAVCHAVDGGKLDSKALLAGPGSSTLSVIDCELSGAGMNLGTRCLLFDVTVTLNEGEVPGLLLESGEVSVEFPLTERTGEVFSGSVAVPPEPLDGFQLYPTEVKAGQALIQEPLGNWNNVHMLLPVRLQKYLLTTPRFEAGDLWNGVLTTQAEDIHLEGAEGGNCAVKLRVYLDGALAQAEDSILYFVSKEKCSTDCRSFVL